MNFGERIEFNSMEKYSIWYILLIGVSLIIAITGAFIAQRKIHNQLLKKRRKRLLIISGSIFLFFLIMGIINHIQGLSVWQDLFTNYGFYVLLFIFVGGFLYDFFRKDKQQKTTDNE